MTAPATTTPDLLREALAALARGWRLIPLLGKKPIPANWPNHPGLTADEIRAEVARGHNIGVLTGAASGGVALVDFDTYKGAEVPPDAPLTATVQTGRGGLHMYFKLPAGATLGNSAGKLAPFVDIKADGGQAVLAGSTHPETHQPYRWAEGRHPDQVGIAAFPVDWLAALTRPRGRTLDPDVAAQRLATTGLPVAPAADRRKAAYLAAALSAECQAVASTPEGQRNHRLNAAAFALGQLTAAGLGQQEVVDALMVAAAQCGLPEAEARTTIKSGLAAGLAEPRTIPDGDDQYQAHEPAAPQDECVIECEEPEPEGPGKPELVLPGGQSTITYFAAELAKLVAPRQLLFARKGEVVRLARDTDDADSQLRFDALSPAGACSVLEDYALFVRVVERGGELERLPAVLSEYHARLLLAAPAFVDGLPSVRAIADYPQPIWHAGKVRLTTAGYDPETRVWTNPEAPALERFASVDDAINAIMEALCDFCYATSPNPEIPDLYLLSALAYLLSCHARHLYAPERAPTFLAEANRVGCGKDLLLKLGVALETGRMPSEFPPPPKDRDELEKRLFAAARGGKRFLVFGNVKGHFSDGAYENYCTAERIEGRLLGVSTNIEYPNLATYCLSGNQLTFSEDLGRRLLRIRLEYFAESLETRTYRYPNLLDHVLRHRGRYLGALQTLVDNWVAAGCPSGHQTKASYVKWASTIGGIIEAAGCRNPINGDTLSAAPNHEVEDLTKLLLAWRDSGRPRLLSAADLRDLATTEELFAHLGDLKERSAATRFGALLVHHDKREYGKLRMVKDPNRKKAHFILEDLP